MEIIGIQFDIAWESPAANFEKVERLVEGADLVAGSLLVLPEMFATGFSMNVGTVAETRGGRTEMFMSAIARKYGVNVMGGVVTGGGDGKGRNEAVVLDPDGKETARYCKRHPFSFAGETDCYQAGDDIVVFEWASLNVSPFICYDLRFPECFRSSVRRGANVFVVIANWPAAREEHWVALLRARAIENQAYVIGVNRCGADPKHAYPGRSMAVGPLGDVIADAGHGEGIVKVRPDPEALAKYRAEFPALADMRAEDS